MGVDYLVNPYPGIQKVKTFWQALSGEVSIIPRPVESSEKVETF
jgi:hypothetical protein